MPRAAALAAAVLAALLAAGCGAQRAVRAPDGVVRIAIRDFRMKPQNVRSRPGPITFVVLNEGRLPHSFRVRGIGGTRMKLKTLLPGARRTRTITLPRGDWRLFCSLANHEELGLYGTLVIR